MTRRCGSESTLIFSHLARNKKRGAASHVMPSYYSRGGIWTDKLRRIFLLPRRLPPSPGSYASQWTRSHDVANRTGPCRAGPNHTSCQAHRHHFVLWERLGLIWNETIPLAAVCGGEGVSGEVGGGFGVGGVGDAVTAQRHRGWQRIHTERKSLRCKDRKLWANSHDMMSEMLKYNSYPAKGSSLERRAMR